MGRHRKKKTLFLESWLYNELWVRSSIMGLEPKREKTKKQGIERSAGHGHAGGEGYTL